MHFQSRQGWSDPPGKVMPEGSARSIRCGRMMVISWECPGSVVSSGTLCDPFHNSTSAPSAKIKRTVEEWSGSRTRYRYIWDNSVIYGSRALKDGGSPRVEATWQRYHNTKALLPETASCIVFCRNFFHLLLCWFMQDHGLRVPHAYH